jgi:uncharacterized protein
VIVLDANVLVALYRADHPHHQLIAPWWARASTSGATVTAPDLVWTGFVRVVTSPRIFAVPATIEEGLGFVRAVRAHPAYLPTGTLPGVLDTFADLCSDGQVTGNLVTDAYIAAVAVSMGAELATLDRDFRRFDGLRILTPSA